MKRILGAVLIGGLSVAGSASALAQDAPPAAETPAPAAETPPAASGSSVPEVEVIQEQAQPKPKPKPAAAKPKPKPKPQQQAAPAPQPEPDPLPPPVAEAPPPPGPTEILPNSPYGSPAASGAASRAAQSATTPSNPTQLVPTNLEGFAGAATNVTPEALEAKQPRNVNEALTGIPGVTVINDDANAHHGGVSVRGSPARRSRKVLVMEDGHANNLALWLDPSVHYWGPVDRFESIEVLRGTVITHGPNNNFGVVNARNLSPFGPAETVISSAIGFTKTDRGTFTPIDEIEDDGEIEFNDAEAVSGKSSTDLSYRWHVHTRQNSENVGIVASYTGANVQGAWDTEQLRFHDFYGAIGWKGSSSDLVVSSSYARQKDDYDEQNFLGEAELDADNEDDAEAIAGLAAGFAENQFALLKHCKTCYAPAAGLNNYNGEIWRGQIVHNAYVDDDTTITSRVYAQYHRRDRYQLNAFDSQPDGNAGLPAEFGDPDPATGESEVFFGENSMFGRLRTFRHVGGEVRGEWANQNLMGFKQTIQAGVRYEYQDMTNRNFIGAENEILKDGDETGATIFDRELKANAVSAFLQTNVAVAQDFNVVPGIRFEWYKASRINRVIAREESEAGGGDEDDCDDVFGEDDCLSVDGIVRNPERRNEDYSNFHALPGVSFAYTGLNRTTIFGGYHRGMSTGVLRNEDFPVDDEIGNNFNLGLRTSAFKGLELEAVGFYQLLSDYQFGASFSDTSDRSFGRADEVEISGVELFGRLNSQPFTGGSYNFYGEANYLYTRGKFKDFSVTDPDDGDVEVFDGNRIPEVPLHIAAFTLGVEQKAGWRWDASVTATYRGAFFTDEGNTPFGFGGEVECETEGGVTECEIEEAGEDGEVPSVWLLSARANMDIGNTGASVFISGDNLTNEFYISDREDGMKPGLGRTIWTGFKYKF
jgi:Fe(3+) dicitrate transport protein